MRRLWLIARREYAAYTRTVGFWLSLMIVPGFAVLGGYVPTLLRDAAPNRAVAIADFTGRGQDRAILRAFAEADREAQVNAMADAAKLQGPMPAEQVRQAGEAGGPEAAMAVLRRVAPQAAHDWRAPRPPVHVLPAPQQVALASSPDAAEAGARRFIAREKPKTASLDDIIILRLDQGRPVARIWSLRTTDEEASGAVRDALKRVTRRERLATLGVDPATLDSIELAQPEVRVFSPHAISGGAVGLRDQLPQMVGFGAGFLLWSLVITAASILMNSVMEEKSNRVLEVLLASADTGEILAGKVIGVAGIAITVIGVWAALGFMALSQRVPGLMDLLGPTFSDVTFWTLTALYFAGGYLMYGMLFAAIGAFCETPRDAQTLLGPIIMVLMAPLLVMEFAVRSPEIPLLRILSWVPLFTPFLMPARLPMHPQPLEIVATFIGMGLMVALMVWLGGKAFRAGALVSGRLDLKALLGLKRRAGAG